MFLYADKHEIYSCYANKMTIYPRSEYIACLILYYLHLNIFSFFERFILTSYSAVTEKN